MSERGAYHPMSPPAWLALFAWLALGAALLRWHPAAPRWWDVLLVLVTALAVGAALARALSRPPIRSFGGRPLPEGVDVIGTSLRSEGPGYRTTPQTRAAEPVTITLTATRATIGTVVTGLALATSYMGGIAIGTYDGLDAWMSSSLLAFVAVLSLSALSRFGARRTLVVRPRERTVEVDSTVFDVPHHATLGSRKIHRENRTSDLLELAAPSGRDTLVHDGVESLEQLHAVAQIVADLLGDVGVLAPGSSTPLTITDRMLRKPPGTRSSPSTPRPE